jgi:hypothetical protein
MKAEDAIRRETRSSGRLYTPFQDHQEKTDERTFTVLQINVICIFSYIGIYLPTYVNKSIKFEKENIMK